MIKQNLKNSKKFPYTKKDLEITNLKIHRNYFIFFLIGFISALLIENFL